MYRQGHESNVLGLASAFVATEGAVKTLGNGNRVDIYSLSRQPSILGFKLPVSRVYIVTRWDKDTDGYHKSELRLDKGEIKITSRAQDPKDRGVLLPFETLTFQRGMLEYEESIRAITEMFGELGETS